jgi:hypothetical protein
MVWARVVGTYPVIYDVHIIIYVWVSSSNVDFGEKHMPSVG